MRRGHGASQGREACWFKGNDVSSGKAHTFDVSTVGGEPCDPTACARVLVPLTGALRWVGPSWNTWYSPEGQLLRFEGPAGDVAVE